MDDKHKELDILMLHLVIFFSIFAMWFQVHVIHWFIPRRIAYSVISQTSGNPSMKSGRVFSVIKKYMLT